MTVLGGWRKSFTAEPSRRNSGLLQTPKSTPAFFPENSSRVGITILCMVPGKMVLRMTTVWRALLLLSASPICSQILRIYRRSRLPFAWLGVPTQTKDSSVSRIASTGSLVARSRPSLDGGGYDFPDVCFNDGRLPAVDQSTLVGSGSTPTTSCPSSARHPAETVPT
jgi:hypothetical protein